MLYMDLDIEKKNNGFYTEDIHGIEKCETILAQGGLLVDEELWQHLLVVEECKFIGTVEQREYTILDKDLFEKIIQPVDTKPQQPLLEERLAALETLMMGVI
ncbi:MULTISPECIES: hypothetical protein [unclassified Clostridium]|uniref:hypothetical protein n=1 Tax=unclassified Clostridium TaxID=2614128 RepID=UPI0032168135